MFSAVLKLREIPLNTDSIMTSKDSFLNSAAPDIELSGSSFPGDSSTKFWIFVSAGLETQVECPLQKLQVPIHSISHSINP